MPQAESASMWQENAALSRPSQMVGNTAQCYVLAPGSPVSTVNRSHQLALGHQHLQPRAPGYCPSLCVHKYTDGQPPSVLGAERTVLWVVFPSDHKLEMPRQRLWNHGQLDMVSGAAVCRKQTAASQASETSSLVLAWGQVPGSVGNRCSCTSISVQLSVQGSRTGPYRFHNVSEPGETFAPLVGGLSHLSPQGECEFREETQGWLVCEPMCM